MIYAVNKRTKKHKVIDRCTPIEIGEWSIIHADDDGWVEWSGGECPLPDYTECEYKTKDGSGGKAPAGGLYWELNMEGGNIIAYRPILDDKPQTQGWNGDGLPPVGTECEFNVSREGDLTEWHRAEIIAYYNGRAVFCMEENKDALCEKDDFPRFFSNGNAADFRPIRTDRERWIEAAVKATGDASVMAPFKAGRIYDAGLAKLPDDKGSNS